MDGLGVPEVGVGSLGECLATLIKPACIDVEQWVVKLVGVVILLVRHMS